MTRETIRVAARESPPKSKKLSWIPTTSSVRISAQTWANSSSKNVLGATKLVCSSGRVRLGAGSAFRSTLPVDVTGIESSTTKDEGIIWSGSFSESNALSASDSDNSLSNRHQVSHKTLLSWVIVQRNHNDFPESTKIKKRSFDFRQLDSVSSDLNLKIFSP